MAGGRLRIVNASSSRFYRLRLEDHPLYLIATDGGAVPSPIGIEEVLPVPGERIDVLVQVQRPTLSYQGRAGRTWNLPGRLIAVEPLPQPASPPRSFVLGMAMGMGMGMSRGMAFVINGRDFDPNRIETQVRLNTVEDWEIINSHWMDHPFHVHTNPFQVLDNSGVPEREGRDTFLVRAGSRVRLRLQFNDYTGTTLCHCHILDHSDLGMMATLQIA